MKQPTTPANLLDRSDRPPLKTQKIVVRPGSQDILKYPSRVASSLFYPDGRVVKDVPQS